MSQWAMNKLCMEVSVCRKATSRECPWWQGQHTLPTLQTACIAMYASLLLSRAKLTHHWPKATRLIDLQLNVKGQLCQVLLRYCMTLEQQTSHAVLAKLVDARYRLCCSSCCSSTSFARNHVRSALPLSCSKESSIWQNCPWP